MACNITLVWCSCAELIPILKGRDFCILGSGSAAELIIRFIKPMHPKHIVDNDAAKHGMVLGGHVVTSPTVLESSKLFVVVMSTQNYFVAARELQDFSDNFFLVIPPVELIYGYK